MLMFVAALVIITKNTNRWKKVEGTKMSFHSFNGWMDKQIVVHPYNRIVFSHKSNGSLIHAVTYVKSYSAKRKKLGQQTTYFMILFMWCFRIDKFCKDRKYQWLPESRGLGWLLTNWMNKRILKWRN